MFSWWRRRFTPDDDPDDWVDRDDEAEPAPDPHDEPVGALVREGRLVRLRRHVPANRAAFQQWYADAEIALLLRHDQQPLSARQSKNYFDSFILPLSARNLCFAIHEAATDRLLGTTALTDVGHRRGRQSALFRIVIGEKDTWGRGYGTEATRMVMEHGFDELGLDEIRLEVFRHNARALRAYERVGFRVTGEHVEWVGRERQQLHVIEMALTATAFRDVLARDDGPPLPARPAEAVVDPGDGRFQSYPGT